MLEGEKDTKLLSVLTGTFVAALLVSNVVAAKLVVIGPFDVSAAIILFPVTYIFGDVLTEVYGYARSRRVIWTAFGCQLGAVVVYMIVVALPPAPGFDDQTAFETVFGLAPRIAVASLCAYWVGEFANSYVLSRMKYRAAGRRGFAQASRFVWSTVVGEAVDTVLFVSIAFAGVFPNKELIWVGISSYVLKVAYEVLAVPVSIRATDWVKRIEGIDHIDHPETTSYNPFALAGEADVAGGPDAAG